MKRVLLFLPIAVALLLATCSDGAEQGGFAAINISLGNSEASRMLVWKSEDGDLNGGETRYHTYELTVLGKNMNPISLKRNGNTLTGSGLPIGPNQRLEIRAYIARNDFVLLDLDVTENISGMPVIDMFTSDKILRAIGFSDPVTINAGINTIAPVTLYSAMEVSSWAALTWAATGKPKGDRKEIIILKDSMNVTYTINIERPITIWAEKEVTITRSDDFKEPFFAIGAQTDSQGDLTIGATPEEDIFNGAIILDGGNIDCNWPLIYSAGNCTIGGKVTLQNNINNYIEESEGLFGGGVCINGGTFTLYGTIKNNSAKHFGGGVIMHSGTFVMKNGAVIEGNSANQGGGVFVGGTFEMNDGAAIRGNEASVNAGGVYISGGTFNMNGGSITGNTCEYGSGGVVVSPGTFNMYIPAIPGPGGSITGNSGGANDITNIYIAPGSQFYSEDETYVIPDNQYGW